MNTFISFLFVFLGAVFVGGLTKYAEYRKLDNCARTNNTYQCEFVAVPKSMKPITDAEVEGLESIDERK